MPLTILVLSAAMGAGLELAFGMFLKGFYELIKQNVKFKPAMMHLAGRLESIRLEIQRIEAAHGELHRPVKIDGLLTLMGSGDVLVAKCSKIGKYNFIKKPLYLRKLKKLESKISDYLNTDLQLQLRADNAEIMVIGVKIPDEVNLINMQLSQVSISPASSVHTVLGVSSCLASSSVGCSRSSAGLPEGESSASLGRKESKTSFGIRSPRISPLRSPHKNDDDNDQHLLKSKASSN